MKRVITFGTFDVFHVGHLNLLERACALGGYLIVGISTDALNEKKKDRYPVFPQEDRRRIIGALNCVSETFYEESLEAKREYLKHYKADILVMGDDWVEKFDVYQDICEVIYLPRTPSISTTETIERIKR